LHSVRCRHRLNYKYYVHQSLLSLRCRRLAPASHVFVCRHTTVYRAVFTQSVYGYSATKWFHHSSSVAAANEIDCVHQPVRTLHASLFCCRGVKRYADVGPVFTIRSSVETVECQTSSRLWIRDRADRVVTMTCSLVNSTVTGSLSCLLTSLTDSRTKSSQLTIEP